MFNFNQVAKINQEFINAITASSTVASKGFQQITAETTEFTKKNYEDSAAVAERLASAKSLETAFTIQSDYAKSAYEAFIAQSTKLGELYTNIAKEAYTPFETTITTAKAKAKA